MNLTCCMSIANYQNNPFGERSSFIQGSEVFCLLEDFFQTSGLLELRCFDGLVRNLMWQIKMNAYWTEAWTFEKKFLLHIWQELFFGINLNDLTCSAALKSQFTMFLMSIVQFKRKKLVYTKYQLNNGNWKGSVICLCLDSSVAGSLILWNQKLKKR